MPRCPESGCATSDSNPLVPHPMFLELKICRQCAIVIENSYEYGAVKTGQSIESELSTFNKKVDL